MFVPFPNDIIKKRDNESSIHVRQQANVSHYVVRMHNLSEIKELATFTMLSAGGMVGVANFALAKVLMNCPVKYKHLYLTLAVRGISKWTKNSGQSKLCIYTVETLMPEILLDEGFKLRHAVRDAVITYRGTKHV